jgi:hypothetical protein
LRIYKVAPKEVVVGLYDILVCYVLFSLVIGTLISAQASLGAASDSKSDFERIAATTGFPFKKSWKVIMAMFIFGVIIEAFSWPVKLMGYLCSPNK